MYEVIVGTLEPKTHLRGLIDALKQTPTELLLIDYNSFINGIEDFWRNVDSLTDVELVVFRILFLTHKVNEFLRPELHLTTHPTDLTSYLICQR